MPGPWRVLLDLPPDDVRDMRAAAPDVIPAERHAFITEELSNGSDGMSLLWIDLPVATENEALAAADALYLEVREVAGLPPLGPGTRPVAAVVRGYALEATPQRGGAAMRGALRWAVVRAQTSVELYAKAAFAEMCSRRFGDSGPRIAKHLRSTLHDDRTTGLLQAIVGENPKMQPWWQAYDAHVNRRHAIVHSGLSVTPDQAAESLQAAADCRGWPLSHWSAI